MLNGYRGLAIAALTAALFVAFGLGAFVTALPKPQERYQAYNAGKTNEGWPLSPVANVAKPTVQRSPCHEPQSETESDLCAQWHAASAAEKSADWTKLGVLTSICGIAFLLWQIILTRKAVEDTGKATVAMEKQNELTAIAQRAWVVFDAKVINAEANAKVFTMLVEVVARNIGHSVARDLSLWAVICDPDNLELNIAKVRQRIDSNEATVSPLVPSDTKKHWMKGGYVIANMKLNPENKRTEFFVFIAARYSVLGDDARKITENLFSLTDTGNDDPFKVRGIQHPIHPLIDHNQIRVIPAGRAKAT